MSSDRHNSRQSRPWRPFTRLMQSLLRLWASVNGRRRRSPQAGFVFPTTLLLILMVLLTVTALTFRSFTRSTQIITERDQQVIYNAATPAIDRAKAKLEFMFRQDPNFIGVPSADYLMNMMLPADERIAGIAGASLPGVDGINDVYTLPDETRLNINGDTQIDNAWSFPADVDGDGEIEAGEIAAYSILVDNEATVGGTTYTIFDQQDGNKAGALVTRTGPIATTEAIGPCPSTAVVEEGWQTVDTSSSSEIQKNFQITAFVSNNSDGPNQTFESLEFQQSRIASSANKWAAWFRYDLDIFPGADLKWNGAMHTDGSLFVADDIESYMLTSHFSCLYNDTSSEITLGQFEYDDGTSFQGQAVKGTIKNNNFGGDNVEFHLFAGNGNKPTTGTTLTNGNHSIEGASAEPIDIAMNPIVLFLKDRAEHIDDSTWDRDADWKDSDFVTTGRIINDETSQPYVDDFFRADNRWGPKPRYDSRPGKENLSLDKGTTATGDDNNIGQVINTGIASIDDELLGTTDKIGLDGYWERRAIKEGFRIVVGERLQLGNANGWGTDPTGGNAAPGDPMYPPATTKSGITMSNTEIRDDMGDHEYRQHIALRDNLAAVQGMVVYHYDINSGNFPAACIALTSHPGTEETLIKSRTFAKWYTGGARTDFLNGQGTNGWEFSYPDDFNTADKFADEVLATKPLGKALRNLAYFAGDPNGGAPSFTPVQDTNVHPYPYQAMWGDFSMLRRIIDGGGLNSDTAFEALSPADQATVHSAACTLSLLAYNLDREISDFDSIDDRNFNSLQNATQRYGDVIGGIAEYMEDGTMANKYKDGSRSLEDELIDRGFDRATWVATCDTNPATATIDSIDPATFNDNDGKNACGAADYFYEFTLNDWIAFAPYAPGGVSDDDIAYLVEFSTQVNRLNSLIRDRDLGFKEGQTTKEITTAFTNEIDWDAGTGYTEVIGVGSPSINLSLKTKCDPNIFRSVGAGGGGGDDNVLVSGMIGCSNRTETPVRYPALYYLFPVEDHDHDGTGDHAQPATEPYIADTYVTTQNQITSGTENRFQVVSSDLSDTDAIIRGVGDIAAIPAPLDPAAVVAGVEKDSWLLPFESAAVISDQAGLDTPANAFNINVCNLGQEQCFDTLTDTPTISNFSGERVALIDKVLFNGREQLPIRVLDIDIDELTTETSGTGNDDYWIPARVDEPDDDDDFATKGVVYAFREDAVREDEIVRPANSSAPSDCDGLATSGGTFKIETEDGCRMFVQAGVTGVNEQVQDPPLQDYNISMKPVDFLPDPDRRPHGFRFKTSSGNPADFSGGDPANGRQYGMTFVTDNTTYIQGDFNLHSTSGDTDAFVEEFTYTLQNRDFGEDDFYDNRTADKLNLDSFAKVDVDHWRPVEILSDALTILSESFNDGAVEDAFIDNNSVNDSSFGELNRPKYGTLSNWTRETAGDDSTPIWIDRNATFYYDGQPFYNEISADGDYLTMRETNARANNRQNAVDTYVNAVFVSGIVPERANQAYGGLHNYPRFLENWDGDGLFISGSFIQLNFSTSATAPFDQDVWEPKRWLGSNNFAVSPVGDEEIPYYDPPDRRWGFDVGLLYNPPAPAAERFNDVGRQRSEYYRELPADDPYIENLRCATDEDGNAVFDNLCP